MSEFGIPTVINTGLRTIDTPLTKPPFFRAWMLFDSSASLARARFQEVLLRLQRAAAGLGVFGTTGVSGNRQLLPAFLHGAGLNDATVERLVRVANAASREHGPLSAVETIEIAPALGVELSPVSIVIVPITRLRVEYSITATPPDERSDRGTVPSLLSRAVVHFRSLEHKDAQPAEFLYRLCDALDRASISRLVRKLKPRTWIAFHEAVTVHLERFDRESSRSVAEKRTGSHRRPRPRPYVAAKDGFVPFMDLCARANIPRSSGQGLLARLGPRHKRLEKHRWFVRESAFIDVARADGRTIPPSPESGAA